MVGLGEVKTRKESEKSSAKRVEAQCQVSGFNMRQ